MFQGERKAAEALRQMLEAEVHDAKVEGVKYGLSVTIWYETDLDPTPDITARLDNTAAI